MTLVFNNNKKSISLINNYRNPSNRQAILKKNPHPGRVYPYKRILKIY